MITAVHRRRVVAGIVVVAFVGVAVAAWAIGIHLQSPSQAAAQAAPPEPSWVTAPVERRVVASTVIARGDVQTSVSTAITGPAMSADVGSDTSGVVTGLFVTRGDEVVAGDRVVEVAGRPVFVFEGATPSFRALRPGMTGADVAQLQAGLVAGGCAAGHSGIYDEATKQCVGQLYADAGYATVRGSTSEVADLAAAQAASDTAHDGLESAETELAAASRPAPAADVAAADVAIDEARRVYDSAVRDQPASIDTAIGTLDEALVTINALLAGSDPSRVDGTVPTGDGSGTSNGADGAGGAASGVAARDAAWNSISQATHTVNEAALDGFDAIAAADSTLRVALAALATLESPPDTSAEQLIVDQQHKAVARAEDDLTALEAVSGAVVPFGEIVFAPELPARVDTVGATVGASAGSDPAAGGGAGASGALIVLASPTLQATVAIPQSARSLVRDGASVELLDESSGETVTGTVTSIADQLAPASLSGAPSYLAAVGADLTQAWSGRNVRATFTTASTDHEVLVVPLAAVSSAADGRTRVQVEGDDGALATVTVSTGLSADGYVEVTATHGASLDEGDRVVIGR